MAGKTLLTIVVVALALLLVFQYGAPFLLALVLAILLDPLVRLCMKYNRTTRRIASFTVCTLFILVMILLSYFLGNKIVVETGAFVKTMEPEQIMTQITDTGEDIISSISPALGEAVRKGVSSLLTSLSGILSGVSGYLFALAKSIPNFFLSFIVFLIALYLISMSLPHIRTKFLSIFEDTTAIKMGAVLDTLRKAVNGYIVAQLIMGCITYIIMLVGLIILDTGYALALAFLVTIVDLLPIFGTGIVLLPWAIYQLVMGNSVLGIGLLILYGVTLVVRRVVEPKVLGNAVGISPLAALASLYVGFKLIGVAGLFLGPLMIIIYQAMREVGFLNMKIKM